MQYIEHINCPATKQLNCNCGMCINCNLCAGLMTHILPQMKKTNAQHFLSIDSRSRCREREVRMKAHDNNILM